MTVHDDAPAADDDPAGHGVHCFAPKISAYVPAKQGMHSLDHGFCVLLM